MTQHAADTAFAAQPTGSASPAPRRIPTSRVPRVLTAAMPRYVAKRLAQSALAVFLTLTTVFVLIRMAPGDPAYSMAGPLASTEDLARIRADMGLDQSVFTQYLLYLRGLVHLDLGTSYSFQAPAFDVVLARLPYTITLQSRRSCSPRWSRFRWVCGWRAARTRGANSAPTSSRSPVSPCPTSGPD